jgi:hypothetical protein
MQISYEIYEPLVAAGAIRELPTARLYLLQHAPALEARYGLSTRFHGANVYSLGETAFIVRSTTAAGLAAARRFSRVVWIIDDHFGEGAVCETLPETYRRRLGDLHRRFEPRVLDVADVVLCSCEALAAFYRDRGVGDVRVVHPLYVGTPAEPGDGAGGVSVGILQTRSHIRDLRSIASHVATVLNTDPRVSFVHCLRGCDTGFPVSPRIEALKAMPWRTYVGWRRPLEIGLYPLLDTGFNRYRSLNKFLEYVGRGAVPLVSDRPAMAEVPSVFRVADEEWSDRILKLADDGAARRALRTEAREWVAGMRFGETSVEILAELVA